MAKNLPYFRWYPADAQTDQNYSLLTYEELGFFHSCLNFSWINGGIPSDQAELGRLMRVTPAQLSRLWPHVGKMFAQCPNDSSKLLNRRQEEERTRATSNSDQASRATAERERLRRERSSSDRSGDHPRAQAGADSASDSDSDSVSEGFSSEGSAEGNQKQHCGCSLHGPHNSACPTMLGDMVRFSVRNTGDVQFRRIIGAFLAAGVALSEQQTAAAAMEWTSLSDADRIGAPEAAEERARQNEARFMGLPASWLRKREWQARGPGRLLPTPRAPSKAQGAQDAAAKAFLAEQAAKRAQ